MNSLYIIVVSAAFDSLNEAGDALHARMLRAAEAVQALPNAPCDASHFADMVECVEQMVVIKRRVAASQTKEGGGR